MLPFTNLKALDLPENQLLDFPVKLEQYLLQQSRVSFALELNLALLRCISPARFRYVVNPQFGVIIARDCWGTFRACSEQYCCGKKVSSSLQRRQATERKYFEPGDRLEGLHWIARPAS